MSAPVRIGNASGFDGDRLSAMREMLEGGELDYLTCDYLAELTMLILGRDRMKDPSTGFAKTFIRQMQDCMGLAQAKGVRIVTNAGGLNPAGCAVKLREFTAEQGLDLSIAQGWPKNPKRLLTRGCWVPCWRWWSPRSGEIRK